MLKSDLIRQVISFIQLMGGLPNAIIACVGGGSNAIGSFAAFIDEPSVRLIGVEAAGEGLSGLSHSATLSKGSIGVLHGCKTYLLQVCATIPFPISCGQPFVRL